MGMKISVTQIITERKKGVASSMKKYTNAILCSFLSMSLLAGCDIKDSKESLATDPSTALPIPGLLLQARTVQRDQLSVEVTLGGVLINVDRIGDTWIGNFSLPDGRASVLEATWFEDFEGVRLPLVSAEPMRIEPNSPRTIFINEYDDAPHDFDEDGMTNLAEREAGTDPFTPQPTSGTEQANQPESIQDPAQPELLPGAGQTDCRMERTETNFSDNDERTLPPLLDGPTFGQGLVLSEPVDQDYELLLRQNDNARRLGEVIFATVPGMLVMTFDSALSRPISDLVLLETRSDELRRTFLRLRANDQEVLFPRAVRLQPGLYCLELLRSEPLPDTSPVAMQGRLTLQFIPDDNLNTTDVVPLDQVTQGSRGGFGCPLLPNGWIALNSDRRSDRESIQLTSSNGRRAILYGFPVGQSGSVTFTSGMLRFPDDRFINGQGEEVDDPLFRNPALLTIFRPLYNDQSDMVDIVTTINFQMGDPSESQTILLPAAEYCVKLEFIEASYTLDPEGRTAVTLLSEFTPG